MNLPTKLAVALSLLSLTSVTNAADSEELIQLTYKAYRTALLANDGLAAWQIVDPNTQHYYERILKDALTLNRKQFDRLTLMSKFSVARLRSEFPKAKLAKLTGRDVFVYGVKNGWIDRESVERIDQLVGIKVTGRLATGSIPDYPTVPIYFFIKHDENWRLALTRGFAMGEAMFKKMAGELGLKEEEFVLKFVRELSRFDVPDSVLDGPIE